MWGECITNEFNAFSLGKSLFKVISMKKNLIILFIFNQALCGHLTGKETFGVLLLHVRCLPT